MSIYRFWSDAYHSHFYTISKSEQEQVVDFYPDNVWRYEGIAYKASTEKTETTHPVYRFWSEAYQKHFYTIDEKEKDKVILGAYPASKWRYEGIAWYSEKSPNNDNFPLYRFWSDAYNGHFYTLSESEKQEVMDKYPDNIWRYEGNAWYGWR